MSLWIPVSNLHSCARSKQVSVRGMHGEDQGGVEGQPQDLDQQHGGFRDGAQLGQEPEQDSLGGEPDSLRTEQDPH